MSGADFPFFSDPEWAEWARTFPGWSDSSIYDLKWAQPRIDGHLRRMPDARVPRNEAIALRDWLSARRQALADAVEDESWLAEIGILVGLIGAGAGLISSPLRRRSPGFVGVG